MLQGLVDSLKFYKQKKIERVRISSPVENNFLFDLMLHFSIISGVSGRKVSERT